MLQINTWDDVGGAAKAAHRLQQGLAKLGHESRYLTGYGAGAGSSQAIISGWPRWKKLLWRGTLALENVSGLQNRLIWWSREFTDHPWVASADIVHLHNLHGGYISHSVLPELSRRKPVVWTLHDMWPLTGHCGYSLDCHRWKTGCGSCPHLDIPPMLTRDLTSQLWKAKQRIYSHSNLTIVTPSSWLADVVRESPLLGQFPVHHIPNGVDLVHFTKVPKAKARERLGLPQDVLMLLFMAEYQDEPRKGGQQLVEAFRLVDDSYLGRMSLLTVGHRSDRLKWPATLKHIDMGSVEDESLLPTIFSAVDLVVVPSVDDNLPNIVLEAMACETPVVAFGVGGIPEMVRHMETGYLAQPGDAQDLANGLEALLQDDELRNRMGRQGREAAERDYSLELQAQNYAVLYREIIQHWGARSPG